MKTLIYSLLAFIISVNGFTQESELPYDDDGKVNYNEVVHTDDVSQGDLYIKAKSMFVSLFKSADNVIQMDDRESGIIVGKGTANIRITLMGDAIPTYFTLHIQVREGRYRYQIYDIYYLINTGYGFNEESIENVMSSRRSDRVKDRFKQNTIEVIQGLINNIKEEMSKNIGGDDDW